MFCARSCVLGSEVSLVGIFHQHGDGHGADSAGYGCDVGCFGGDGGIIDIADEAVAARLGGVVYAVDADVDDGDAVANHVCGDKVGSANGGDQNVCLSGDGGKVAGAGVAEGDGGVAGYGFAHHEKGGWFADDLAAAKDDDMAPFGFDAAMPDEFDDACGGAGDEAALIFLAESAYVDGVEAVDVFMWGDTVEGLGFVDVRWEGCLNKDAVDIGVVVECIDLIEEGFFGDVFGQEVQAAVDADALGGLLLFADVGDGCGVVSDADKSDCWLFPRKTPDLAGEFFNDGFCDGVSVNYLHDYSKSWSVPFVNSDASCGACACAPAGVGFVTVVDLKLQSEYSPRGDQPEAIRSLVESVRAGNERQTLLGVTGSGKTFTMANVIQELQRPALIISHNKTLAAQLYSEFKAFFPENAVEYFVSYYDYYQPEAYIPQTDTYIEKDSSINDDIERLRISAASSLISRRDVIVVASVSCIYGLGSPEDFKEMMLPLSPGLEIARDTFLARLVEILYERNDVDFKRGTFRVRGDVVDVYPAYMETGIRVEFWGDEVESIRMLDPLTGTTGEVLEGFHIYPATQYATSRGKVEQAVAGIRGELEERVGWFEANNHLLEAQRIRMRTEYDIELLQEMGFCTGIENYSRYMSGRKPGDRPFCLIDFFPEDFLLFIDESHVTLPQVRAMYNGDRARKERLVEHGFRLPSALDNRPQKFAEFESITGQTIYVSATPAAYEMEVSETVAEQLIRPTGLLDPEIELRPIQGQVEDVMGEVRKAVEAGERTLLTTLTKRMSEDLSDFLRESGLQVEYLHSDIDAIERVEILRRLRKGEFDVLVGVNLLREGLDLPEVALVGILDADKEGFLRSATSLIQTAGRAARHEKGRVILYADRVTESIRHTLETTAYRREKQMAHNEAHGIVPKGVERGLDESLQTPGKKYAQEGDADLAVAEASDKEVAIVLAEMEEAMLEAARKLEFEKAAMLRDQMDVLQSGKVDPSTGALKSKPGRKSRGRGVYNAQGLPRKGMSRKRG